MIQFKATYTKLYLFSLLIFCLPISASEGISANKIKPSILKVTQTTEKETISTPLGYIYSLPKIIIETINQEWAFTPQNTLQDSPSLNRDVIDEIHNLSQKLGFKIRGPENLDLYREAAKWLGTRYRWAGKSKKGVDCSGLTSILLDSVYNKSIPRSSNIIAKNLETEINPENLKPGDLVFFCTRRSKRINHVGIYLGERLFIHASRAAGVIVSSLDEIYYSKTLVKAGRI